MAALAPSRRFGFLLALAALAALAAAPRAAELPAPHAKAVEDLSRGAERPDDFKRVLEGSADRRGDVDAPEVLGRSGARGRSASAGLDRPEQGPRLGGAV